MDANITQDTEAKTLKVVGFDETQEVFFLSEGGTKYSVPLTELNKIAGRELVIAGSAGDYASGPPGTDRDSSSWHAPPRD